MQKDRSTPIKDHPVVPCEEWLKARTAFLAKEKEFTRLRDELSRQPEAVAKGAVVYNHEKTDMDMADREGVSVFYRDEGGAVFHTYSSYARGIDILNGAYNFLDLTPKGRDEKLLDFTQAWVRYHDRYDD